MRAPPCPFCRQHVIWYTFGAHHGAWPLGWHQHYCEKRLVRWCGHCGRLDVAR